MDLGNLTLTELAGTPKLGSALPLKAYGGFCWRNSMMCTALQGPFAHLAHASIARLSVDVEVRGASA